MSKVSRRVVVNVSVSSIRNAVVPIAQAHGLKSVFLFGSHAREESRTDSDIDLFVDYGSNHPLTLFPIIALTQELEESLGRPVDVITARAMEQSSPDPIFDNALESEKVLLYEAV